MARYGEVGDQYAADARIDSQMDTKRKGAYLNLGGPSITTEQLQNWFRVWADSTEVARQKMSRDYQYAEGNGKQWLPGDRQRVLRQGRPALEFNQILPQVEFVCGMQRDMEMDFKCFPRNFNDIRLSEIATSTIKAAMDFGRVHRTTDRVFDDAVITGLGVWEVLHTFDDADDMLWGDIIVNRIHPQAFIYDPWAVDLDLQDGAFMGKAIWMDIGAFRDKYPDYAHLAVPGEWLGRINQLIGSSDDLGTGPNLIPELWDQGTGRIRVLHLWYKVPTDIVLLVDERTGDTKEFDTKANAELYREYLKATAGQKAIESLQIVSTGSVAMFADRTGQPIVNPMTGTPAQFPTSEMATMALNQMANAAGLQAVEGIQVIKRTCRKPHMVEMVYWQVLEHRESPFRDRKYPFVPYISRRWADDPDSIFGVVRNLWDPQDEYNKRYSNLLAHSNSASHSGWLNAKMGGANKAELELMGSKPGVVVEYGVTPPKQIEPTQLPSGHFAMIQMGEKNILRISSINAEMVGQTTQQTVSGRAIRARQAGGSVGLKPRFRTFEESQLDLVRMIFSRVQQYYPPEKIRRIIGTAEMSMPMGPGGQPLFTDPVTGMPVPEEQIFDFLQKVTEVEFDIVFGLQAKGETERQAQFEKSMQAASLVAQSGRPIGPATMNALIDIADLPSAFSNALKLDMMGMPVGPVNPQSQAQALGKPSGKGGPQGDGAPRGGYGESSAPTAARRQAASTREAAKPGGTE